MLVKCRKCKNKLDRADAFKVVVGGKNTYYCNEQEYNELIKEREQRDSIYQYIENILGYQTKNTTLYKEMNELFKIYGIALVCLYLQQEEEKLKSIINSKDFVSEYAKIRYLAAILKNSLTDFKTEKGDQEPEIIKAYDDSDIEVKFTRKKKRRSLADIENNM